MSRIVSCAAILGLAAASSASCASRAPTTVAIRSPAAPEAAATPTSGTPKAPPQAIPSPTARATTILLAPGEGTAGTDESDQTDGDAAAEAAPGPRGWLGVELEPAGPGEAGVRIARVVPKSPAAQAGLLPGDVIQRLDNDPVSVPADVVAAVGSRGAGSRVGVMLKRQSADRLIAVTLAAAPEREEIYRMGFVDQPAPQFESLSAAKGNVATTIGAQRGHVLVVEFWSPDCVPCRAMIPHMNQLHAQYGARGLRVIGITTEPVTRAASAAAELGIDYPVLSDEDRKTTIAYQAMAIPTVFVIDRAGTVRDVMVGYDPRRIAKVDELVGQLLAAR